MANRPPVANAGPDKSAAQGASVGFNGSGSSDPDGTIVGWSWTFGDGGTATGMSPSHAYTAPGTYTAQLTVTDNRNATATDSATVTVSPASPTIWARRMGGTASDGAEAVATDSNGNVIVAGTFRGTVDFGGTSLTSAGGADWFVAKYSPTGTLVWAKRMGGSSDDAASDVAVAANGDVVATGRFSGSASFGGTALVASGTSDIALARYNAADGGHQWSKRFGGAYDDNGGRLAIDGTGAILLTGYFRGTIDFGLGPLRVPFETDLDVFVAKFTAQGATVWAKNFVNDGNDRGFGIGVDANGSVFLAGTFSNAINFGGGELFSPNALIDIFVCKLDANGGHVWSRQIGSPTASEGAEGLAVDPAGNVVVTGYAIAAINFGGGQLDAFGSSDAFVAKYAGTSGAHVWSRRVGGLGNDYGSTVATDASGNVWVAGSFDDTASFGGTTLTSSGMEDTYVMKLSSTGGVTWARRFGGTGSDTANAVAVLASGHGVMGGYFYGSASFSGISLTASGTAADAYVATVAP